MYKVANFNNLPIKGDMTDDLSAKHTKLWINAIVSSNPMAKRRIKGQSMIYKNPI
jgi:hypothetical protein